MRSGTESSLHHSYLGLHSPPLALARDDFRTPDASLSVYIAPLPAKFNRACVDKVAARDKSPRRLPFQPTPVIDAGDPMRAFNEPDLRGEIPIIGKMLSGCQQRGACVDDPAEADIILVPALQMTCDTGKRGAELSNHNAIRRPLHLRTLPRARRTKMPWGLDWVAAPPCCVLPA